MEKVAQSDQAELYLAEIQQRGLLQGKHMGEHQVKGPQPYIRILRVHGHKRMRRLWQKKTALLFALLFLAVELMPSMTVHAYNSMAMV